MARDVTHISRMQLDDELLARLGQKADAPATDARPDFVFYTGCNVLKTPHIALLALDVMDTIGATYQVMGGPSHCCGVVQIRTGDVETSGRFAQATMDKLASSKSGQVVSWCPSCHIQFTETTLPTVEKVRGAKPFEMTPFMLYLRANLDRLRPHLRERVPMRIALHKHPGVHGVVEAAEDILRAVPGVELVDLKQPAIGAMSNYFRALPALRRELQQKELDAAEAAGIDALVAVYHADHRELCAHEAVRPFRIMNMLEIVGASMGLHRDDNYKRLKIMNDVDAIAADCQRPRRPSTASIPRPRGRRSRRCSRSSRCLCVARQRADDDETHSCSARRPCGRCLGRRAGLSNPLRHHHRAVYGRRAERSRRPRLCRRTAPAFRAVRDLRDREPAGRRGHPRHRGCHAGEPDGYTLLMGGIAPLVLIPPIQKVRYDTARDFAPLGLMWRSPQTFTVHPNVGVKTVAEFVAKAKANPGKLTIGSAGLGTVTHLANELLRRDAGIDFVHVPYKSTANSLNDLLGGHIDAIFGDTALVKPQADAGKLVALAVTGAAVRR